MFRHINVFLKDSSEDIADIEGNISAELWTRK